MLTAVLCGFVPNSCSHRRSWVPGHL